MTGSEPPLAFLFDIDNTLLNNDNLKSYLSTQISDLVGRDHLASFWAVYEQVRHDKDVVDIPTTIERYAAQSDDPSIGDQLTQMIESLPFSTFLYPESLHVIRYIATLGVAAILSDGDQHFQLDKINESGIAAAVSDQVFIFEHKEDHVPELEAALPAGRYVMIDDKIRILSALKAIMGDRLCTVHVLQGHYALEKAPENFTPDVTLNAIGDLLKLDAAVFLPA